MRVPAHQRDGVERSHHAVDGHLVIQMPELGMRQRELRIERDRAIEVLTRVQHGLRRSRIGQVERLQILVVGQGARAVTTAAASRRRA